MRIILATSILASSLALVACGDSSDGGDKPTKAPVSQDDDARRGTNAMLTAVSSGTPSSAGLARAEGANAFRSLEDSGDIDIDVGCEGGGLMTFTGALDIEIPEIDIPEVNPEDIDPENPGDIDVDGIGDLDPSDYVPTVSFTFSVGFEGCTVEGVTMDGTLDYSMDTLWENDDVSFEWDYSGLIEFSGAVDGACNLNFGGSAAGVADWADADPADFEGDICGFEADAALGGAEEGGEDE